MTAITCSAVPKHMRQCWTAWLRVSVWRWHLAYASTDAVQCQEWASERGQENLVLGPGETPVAKRGMCHRGPT